jgi:hypothetical protein
MKEEQHSGDQGVDKGIAVSPVSDHSQMGIEFLREFHTQGIQ